MRHPVAPTLVTASILVAILTACAPGDGSQDPLIVYSGRAEELVQPLIDRFTEDTGIEVEVRYGESPELAATLLAEGGNTEADVFFAQDPASLGTVVEMLAVLPDELLDSVETRFRDRNGRWVGTSGRVRAFVYNTGSTQELPTSIDDVTGPEWASHLGVAPTNGSFLAFVAAMILERGEQATLEWLDALAANQPVDYPGNSPIVEAVDTGEVDAGLVNHYYLLRLRAEGAGGNAENWFIPAGDVGSLLMPAGAGVLADSDRADDAVRFVDYLLSAAAQEYFALETFEFPLVAGVAPAPGLPDLDEIETPDVDLSALASVLDTATRLVAEAGLV